MREACSFCVEIVHAMRPRSVDFIVSLDSSSDQRGLGEDCRQLLARIYVCDVLHD